MINRDANRPQKRHESFVYVHPDRNHYDVWPGDYALMGSWDGPEVTFWRFNGEEWRGQ